MDNPVFDGSFGAEGMYENMRFIVRLSPINHERVNSLGYGVIASSTIDYESLKSYSTFIHENIHWWQHIGSTSGIIYSLSYLAQFYINRKNLLEIVKSGYPYKPLLKVHLSKSDDKSILQGKINTVVNNYMDIEFYKMYAFNPVGQIKQIVTNPFFESIGHSYSTVYANVILVIASIIDRDFMMLPDVRKWGPEFSRLRGDHIEGYHDRSPIRVPPLGLLALYEGQARMNQLHYLSRATGNFDFEYWSEHGYLKGIYAEAFNFFLEITDSDRPTRIDSPITYLFLLVCDFAINPSVGFPLDIKIFEHFIDDVDAGFRFLRLCLVVKDDPDIKDQILECSKEEYIRICSRLSDASGLSSPFENFERIKHWADNLDSIRIMLDEGRKFKFEPTNMPVRVILSRFLSFSLDRLEKPEFFCWPGYWMVGSGLGDDIVNLWGKHLSLFSDRDDKPGVYPRMFPNVEKDDLISTLTDFYNSIPIFDLTRQWVLFDGNFSINYTWLAEKYNAEQAKEWANSIFADVYGISISDVKLTDF